MSKVRLFYQSAISRLQGKREQETNLSIKAGESCVVFVHSCENCEAVMLMDQDELPDDWIERNGLLFCGRCKSFFEY